MYCTQDLKFDLFPKESSTGHLDWMLDLNKLHFNTILLVLVQTSIFHSLVAEYLNLKGKPVQIINGYWSKECIQIHDVYLNWSVCKASFWIRLESCCTTRVKIISWYPSFRCEWWTIENRGTFQWFTGQELVDFVCKIDYVNSGLVISLITHRSCIALKKANPHKNLI